MPLRRALTSVMHGIGFAFDQLASESQLQVVASKWMREIDLALHPWGEPGVVPTEVGCWYLQSRDDPESPWGEEQPVVTVGSLPGSLARSPVSVYGIGWSWSALAVDDTQGSVCRRFRSRWTPEGPVTP